MASLRLHASTQAGSAALPPVFSRTGGVQMAAGTRSRLPQLCRHGGTRLLCGCASRGGPWTARFRSSLSPGNVGALPQTLPISVLCVGSNSHLISKIQTEHTLCSAGGRPGRRIGPDSVVSAGQTRALCTPNPPQQRPGFHDVCTYRITAAHTWKSRKAACQLCLKKEGVLNCYCFN